MDELSKLENAFGLAIDDIKQMIGTIEYMFLQSAYHLVKLQTLQNDLINEQQFEENKVRVRIFFWSNLEGFFLGEIIRWTMVD